MGKDFAAPFDVLLALLLPVSSIPFDIVIKMSSSSISSNVDKDILASSTKLFRVFRLFKLLKIVRAYTRMQRRLGVIFGCVSLAAVGRTLFCSDS